MFMAKADKVSKALKELSKHQKLLAPFDMRKAFAGKGDRFAEFSAAQDDLLLDFSKCAVTGKTMKLLLALAKAADVAKKRDAMFAGAIINTLRPRGAAYGAAQPVKTPVMVAGKE
jgi:glucose-6-phosphate isomerase